MSFLQPDSIQEVMTFQVLPDGHVQNIKGDLGGQIPDQKYFFRMICAAQKALINEEVACITVTADKYILKLTAGQQYYEGSISLSQ